MHRRHSVDQQLETDATPHRGPPPSSESLTSYPSNFMPGSDSESESSIDLDHPHGFLPDEDDDEPSLEPPPSYEQSIATPPSSSTSSSASRQPSRSNPFLQSTDGGRAFAHHEGQLSLDQERFVPIMVPRHSPSAPPLNLLASTTSSNNNNSSSSNTSRSSRGGPNMRTSRTLGDLISTTANTSSTHINNAPANDNDNNINANGERRSSTSRGKRPLRNRRKVTSTDNEYENTMDNDVEALAFGVQPAVSPSYMHPSATSSSTSVASSQQRGDYQDNYLPPQHASSTGQLRTARRLQHKQAHARHAASAPHLYPSQPSPPPQQQPHEVSAARAAAVAAALSAPRVPLSQSVIPAPPPRLLQFRSRESSSVPACPFLLCQKPITYTKTRRERGVTVWIVCGLLFLCNTYWTTQSLISHFSSPERVLAEDTANSGFTARGEAGHLMKGFLGFKTHRYKEPQFKTYQRHQSALKRPTIATVGVVQDDTSVLRAILSFGLLVLMAIVRWWMCLTPLLIRPLFDTVHSCPHPHPYPFPQELEQERREKEEEERKEEEEVQRQLARQQQSLQDAWSNWYGGDEKQRLRARDEAERAALEATSTPSDEFSRGAKGDSGPNNNSSNNNTPSIGDESQEPEAPTTTSSEGTSETTTTAAAGAEGEDSKKKKKKTQGDGGRFKFFRRFRAARQQKQEQGKQVLATTVIQIKKKQLSWRARREERKKEERRKAIIKASQDIGRYSLLYQLGSFFMLDRWGQSAIVGPGKQQ